MNNAIRLLAAALLLLLLIAGACQKQAIAADQPFAGASTMRHFSGGMEALCNASLNRTRGCR